MGKVINYQFTRAFLSFLLSNFNYQNWGSNPGCLAWNACHCSRLPIEFKHSSSFQSNPGATALDANFRLGCSQRLYHCKHHHAASTPHHTDTFVPLASTSLSVQDRRACAKETCTLSVKSHSGYPRKGDTIPSIGN